MNLPFFHRRYLHIVTVEVGQVSIRIVRAEEREAFKVYFSHGEDAVATVLCAISVINRDI